MSIDALGAPMGAMSASMEQQTLGAEVVKGTLDKMNENPVTGKTDSSYDFNNSVLSAAYTGKGGSLNINV